MNRRAVLSALGGLAAAGVAGCVSDGNGAASPENTEPDTESPTEATETETATGTDYSTETTDGGCEDATSSSTPSDELVVVDSSLTVTDTGCGQQTDSAQVCYEGDASEVLIIGTIWGSDTCKRPVLADVTDDAEADELVVTVATENPESEGTPACGQCITELGYRATVTFDEGLPGAVTVRHSHDPDASEVVTESQR